MLSVKSSQKDDMKVRDPFLALVAMSIRCLQATKAASLAGTGWTPMSEAIQPRGALDRAGSC